MMKKEWTNKEYDMALLVIRRWLNSRKFETLHQGELEQIIVNYDTYMNKCEEVRKILNEFKEIPHEFRCNVNFYNRHYLK